MTEVDSAFVPGFEYDVFVSFAWVDNQLDPGTRPKKRWVSTFREGLLQRVDQELGRSGATKLFIDTGELDNSRGWGKQLEEALDRTAVFVMGSHPAISHPRRVAPR